MQFITQETNAPTRKMQAVGIWGAIGIGIIAGINYQ